MTKSTGLEVSVGHGGETHQRDGNTPEARLTTNQGIQRQRQSKLA